MRTLAIRGRVVTDREVWDGATVLIEGSAIRSVGREPARADETVEMPESFLVPGFVDLQVNGAFGIDVATRPDRLGELSGKLLATGTTSYLPTVVSLPLQEYPSHLSGIPLGAASGAEPLGLHLEGPFINPDKKGAHREENIVPPDVEALAAMLDAATVRMITMAPELNGAPELIEVATERGVLVSLGHSDADFEAAREALDSGAGSVTHLFNAMSPFHHRDPGLPGAALSHPRCSCGIIADGRHVHPKVVKLAFKVLGPDRLYLVTDAISAAGMGDGEYSLAGRRVYVEDATPRLEDGTIAGSVLKMDDALKNALEFTGCTLPEAVRMASTTPARLVGEGERKGRLARNYDADIAALSAELEVEAVWVKGEQALAP